MKILQLPDLNEVLRVVRGGTNGVPIIASDPGDKIPGIYGQVLQAGDLIITVAVNTFSFPLDTPLLPGYGLYLRSPTAAIGEIIRIRSVGFSMRVVSV